jgi:hypothetical protein
MKGDEKRRMSANRVCSYRTTLPLKPYSRNLQSVCLEREMSRPRDQVRLGAVIDDLRRSMESLTYSQLWLLSMWIFGNALRRVVGNVCSFCYARLMKTLRENDQRETNHDNVVSQAPEFEGLQENDLTRSLMEPMRVQQMRERSRSYDN